MVRTLRAFLEFCYLVRRNVIDEKALNQIQESLDRFYQFREIFKDTNVVNSFSLPRQHSMKHYIDMIRLFGAPNGLCSSITESKHIKAVKEPYQRSNRNQPLGQMLLTNQRLDKLATARRDFAAQGMLDSPILADVPPSNAQGQSGAGKYTENKPRSHVNDMPSPKLTVTWTFSKLSKTIRSDPMKKIQRVLSPLIWTPLPLRPMFVSHKPYVSLLSTDIYLNPHPFLAEHNRARTVRQLGEELNIQNIVSLFGMFLFEQQHQDDGNQHDLLDIPEHNYPYYDGKIKVVNSASALFYAPSDASGIHGMRQEIIRSTPLWRDEGPRYDCAFVNVHPETDPMSGLEVVRVLTFFSFYFRGTYYPCAVVHWFNRVGDEPDEDTGMWLVRPQFDQQHVTRKISCRLRGDGLDGQVKGRCSRRDATSFEMTRQDLGRSGVLKARLGRDKIPCIA